MCICTPNKRTPWCNMCVKPIRPEVCVTQFYQTTTMQAPIVVMPQMIAAGLSVFHKTFLDRETMLAEMYRAMSAAKA